MSARSKARKRALDVLFEAEQRGADVLETLAGRVAAARPAGGRVHGRAGRGRGRPPRPDRRAADDVLPGLVAGPDARRRPRGAPAGHLRAALARRRAGRGGDRPGRRAGPSLSTDDSPAFVNGLLGRLLELKPMLAPSGERIAGEPDGLAPARHTGRRGHRAPARCAPGRRQPSPARYDRTSATGSFVSYDRRSVTRERAMPCAQVLRVTGQLGLTALEAEHLTDQSCRVGVRTPALLPTYVGHDDDAGDTGRAVARRQVVPLPRSWTRARLRCRQRAARRADGRRPGAEQVGQPARRRQQRDGRGRAAGS